MTAALRTSALLAVLLLAGAEAVASGAGGAGSGAGVSKRLQAWHKEGTAEALPAPGIRAHACCPCAKEGADKPDPVWGKKRGGFESGYAPGPMNYDEQSVHRYVT